MTKLRLLFLIILVADGAFAVPANAQSIVFTNVRIVDGNGGYPIENGVIVVDGKKIVAAGPRSSVAIPGAGANVSGILSRKKAIAVDQDNTVSGAPVTIAMRMKECLVWKQGT